MRTIGDRTTTERRYFITSLDWRDDAQLLSVLRGHWSVENHLHWTLDVAFKEDDSAVHEGHGPENLSLLRKIALTALKRTTTFKAGLARRRKRAGWDDRIGVKHLGAPAVRGGSWTPTSSQMPTGST